MNPQSRNTFVAGRDRDKAVKGRGDRRSEELFPTAGN